jgi:hypothetical protein
MCAVLLVNLLYSIAVLQITVLVCIQCKAYLRIVLKICPSCLVMSCIALHCIALHCIALHCIVLYCIVLYCIVLYCIVLYCSVLYCIVLYCIVLYCIVLCCIVLYYMYVAVLYMYRISECIGLHVRPFVSGRPSEPACLRDLAVS